MHNNLLVVQSTKDISKFTAGETGQLISLPRVYVEKYLDMWSNTQTVIDYARGLAFVIQKDKCLSFNVETGLKVKIFS